MKTIKKAISYKLKAISPLLASCFLILASCNDYLDLEPTNSVSDKLIWTSKANAQLVVNNMYEDIAYLGNYNSGECLAGMTEALTDEFKYGDMTYNSLCYIPSEFAYGGAATLATSYVSTYLGSWSTMYRYIARANQGIANLRKYASFDQQDRDEVEAELRFFRAFYYAELAKKYHSVVLYDEDMDKYQKDTPLTPENEVYEFIYQDLKFAAEHLPVSLVPNGRLTSGAAYAFLSRVMLYAERWQDAHDAALKVMSMGYEMPADLGTPFTPGGQGAILQYCYNKESITHSFDNYYAPGGDKNTQHNSIDGGYGTPTQEMVESFELKTGGKPNWEAWHDADGVTGTPPYDQLEPRFAFTILYNGAEWKGRTIEPFVGGADGYAQWKVETKPAGRTTTGYYLRKLVDEDHDFSVDQRCTKPWTAIRYAEVLLNYAEACYRLNKPEQALDALNQVRTRPAVGLPRLNGLSGSDLMAAIRQERKVELAFEGQYYWDMRRWRLAESAFSNYRVHGFRIEKKGDGTFTYYYVECDTEDRHFPAKMYTTPLPESELSSNKSVQQFPEWN